VISGVSAASNIRKTLCVGSVYNENRTDAEESSGDAGIDGSVGLPLPTECRSFSSVCGTEWGNLTNFGLFALAHRVRPHFKVPVIIELGQVPIGFDRRFLDTAAIAATPVSSISLTTGH